jgi:two-component system nitrate/nitrite response regulator NarL
MPLASETKRLIIVDDHPQCRAGCRVFLEAKPGLNVCGEAGSIPEARTLLATHQPHLLLLDLKIGDVLSYDFIREVRRDWSKVRVLTVSMLDEETYAPRVLQAGGSGYVGKQASAEELYEAVQQVLAGRMWFPEAVMRREPAAGNGTLDASVLTEREFQIFEMVSAGKSNSEIAAALGVSTRTVETHKENARLKLHLPSAAALQRAAVLWRNR